MSAGHPYRRAALTPPLAPAMRWGVRGLPFSPSIIIPTLADAALHAFAEGWSRGARLHCAFAAAALAVWLPVFVRRMPQQPLS